MEKIKLLYVHGYLGHGNGSASQLIKAELDKRGVQYSLDAPDFPVTKPSLMRKMLTELIAGGKYDYVIASSLGAFYAMQTFGPFRILINPAMPENLKAIRDSEPAEKNPQLTDEFIEKIQKTADYFFDVCHDEESVFLTYLVYGNQDAIAGNEDFFKHYYYDESHFFLVDMEHKLDKIGAEKVCDIIEKIETEQPMYENQLELVLAKIFEECDIDFPESKTNS